MTGREKLFFNVGMLIGMTMMWVIATVYLMCVGYLPV